MGTTVKLTIKTTAADNFSAIRLEMIKNYFQDAFRCGTFHFKRDPSGMVKVLEVSNISESQAVTINNVVPKIWPGVYWDIAQFVTRKK